MDFTLLNNNEMLLIRGGADVPKPITKPREVWDLNYLVDSQKSGAKVDFETLLAGLFDWLNK